MPKLVTFGMVGDEIQNLKESGASAYRTLKRCKFN
jgi:hypothetical protein